MDLSDIRDGLTAVFFNDFDNINSIVYLIKVFGLYNINFIEPMKKIYLYLIVIFNLNT